MTKNRIVVLLTCRDQKLCLSLLKLDRGVFGIRDKVNLDLSVPTRVRDRIGTKSIHFEGGGESYRRVKFCGLDAMQLGKNIIYGKSSGRIARAKMEPCHVTPASGVDIG